MLAHVHHLKFVETRMPTPPDAVQLLLILFPQLNLQQEKYAI